MSTRNENNDFIFSTGQACVDECFARGSDPPRFTNRIWERPDLQGTGHWGRRVSIERNDVFPYPICIMRYQLDRRVQDSRSATKAVGKRMGN